MRPFSIVAPTASADGYGYSAEALILAAVRTHGADVALVGHDWADERYSDPELLALKRGPEVVSERETAVVYFLPYALPRYRAEARVLLSMTMWESDRIPDAWARIVSDCADGLIVPSAHGAEVFRERADVPVEVTPFGTDVGLYAYRERPERPACTFLMAGLLHYRKGLEFALRAFREEFPSEPDVRLVLKTRLTFLDYGSEWGTLSDARVSILDHDMTREEMRDLYQSADALLAPSRGEGSGLTPRDAMATGLPVIATDWGGLAEIADERYGYPIEVECLEEIPAENSSYGRGVTGGGEIGRFARPSVPAIRAAMRAVYEDRSEARRRGREAAAWMRREWSWEDCSARWLGAIERLSAGVPA